MPIIPDKELEISIPGHKSPDRGLEFYFASAFDAEFSALDFSRIHYFNSSSIEKNKLRNHYRSYPTCPQIELSRNLIPLAEINLEQLYSERKSTTFFTGEKLSFEELSTILRYGYGVKSELPPEGSSYEESLLVKRTAPSGGGCSPIELYLVIINVEGLEPGLYHYNIKNYSLELLKPGSQIENLQNIFSDSIDFKNAGCVFLMTGVFLRTTLKYGLRGWRILFLDAGHMAMGFWMLATALKLGASSLAGGYDRKICRYLDINPHQQGILQSFILGKF